MADFIQRTLLHNRQLQILFPVRGIEDEEQFYSLDLFALLLRESSSSDAGYLNLHEASPPTIL